MLTEQGRKNMQNTEKKQESILKLFLLETIAVILTLLLISCTTLQTANDLSLVFPVFPDMMDDKGNSCVVLDGDNGNVTMPLQYWLSIANYVNYVEQERKIYESWKGEKQQ